MLPSENHFVGTFCEKCRNIVCKCNSEKQIFTREETTTLVLKMQHDFTKYVKSCHYGQNLREIADWTDKWLKDNLK